VKNITLLVYVEWEKKYSFFGMSMGRWGVS